MKKSWNICRFEIQLLFAKPSSYILMFALPLLFTFLFGSLFAQEQEKDKFLLVDEDNSRVSNVFYEYINEGFTMEKVEKELAVQLIENKDATGIIIIPKGFQKELEAERTPNIRFQHIPEYTESETILSVIENTISIIHTKVIAAKMWSDYSEENWLVMFEKLQEESNTNKLTRIVVGESLSGANGVSRSAIGFSIMFTMMAIIGVMGSFIELRRNGVWNRLVVTSASSTEIILGYILAYFLIGWIQFGGLIVATTFLFNIYWGPALYLFILISTLILVIVTLGLAITNVSKTVEQQAGFMNIIVISSCMLAGVYWPSEIMPTFMQNLAEFIPQSWAIRGFENISKGSFDWTVVGVLFLFILVFLLISMKKVRIK